MTAVYEIDSYHDPSRLYQEVLQEVTTTSIEKGGYESIASRLAAIVEPLVSNKLAACQM